MSRIILLVAANSNVLLALSQVVSRFGYEATTSYPCPADLDRAARVPPSLVILHAGDDEAGQLSLVAVNTRFALRKVPVIACVPASNIARMAAEIMPAATVIPSNPLKLNELYCRIQEILDRSQRKELRIKLNLIVAHRESNLHKDDFYYYDTMLSLSNGGCFIQTDAPYSRGTLIEMNFFLGEDSKKISVLGEVRHHGASGDTGEHGMGIEFKRMNARDRARLMGYLTGQLAAGPSSRFEV